MAPGRLPLHAFEKPKPQTQEILDELDGLVDNFRETLETLRGQFEAEALEEETYQNEMGK